MATSQNGSNTATGSNNAVTFSAVDFQRWNRATSGVGIPSRTVKTSGIPQLRGGLIDAIVERGVAAVRALSPTRFGIERRYSSDRRAADVGGVAFRGVQLAPLLRMGSRVHFCRPGSSAGAGSASFWHLGALRSGHFCPAPGGGGFSFHWIQRAWGVHGSK